MKSYILEMDGHDGIFIFVVYANSFEEAFEKIKSPDYLYMTDDESFRVFDGLHITGYLKGSVRDIHANFMCRKNDHRCDCTLKELKESDTVIFLGKYIERGNKT